MNDNDPNKQTDDLETQNTMNRIYTVGHSNHEIEYFIQLLKKNNITAVYDVRSVPYSRYVPQFNQDTIKQSLIHAGIEYVYLGKELGPFSKDLNCCVEGIVQYIRTRQRSRPGTSYQGPRRWHLEMVMGLIKRLLMPGNCFTNLWNRSRWSSPMQVESLSSSTAGDRSQSRRDALLREFSRRLRPIALIHQRQRRRDEMGNVIAEYSDYFIAYQLVGDAFRESLGEGQRYTDDRMRLIESEGQMTPRALSKKESVSTATISQWLKPLIEKGVLSWCDEKGNEFMDVAELEKAKRSGRAYLKVVVGECRLPSVFELTGDPGWNRGGELYAAYDLQLDGDADDQAYHQDGETDGGQDVIIDFENATSNDKPAVKVLSEKSHAEVLKMVDDFRKSEQANGPNSVVSIDLSKEFAEILTSDRYGLVN